MRYTRWILVPLWMPITWWCGCLTVHVFIDLVGVSIGVPRDAPVWGQFRLITVGISCFWMLAYGAHRVLIYHPAGQINYRDWLATTPWHSGIPLPLGPVHVVWQDALMIAMAMGVVLYNGWLISAPPASLLMWLTFLVCSFTLGYTVVAASEMANVQQFEEPLLLILGLPVAALVSWSTGLLLVATLLLLALAVLGLRRSLRTFPWMKEKTRGTEWLGWPMAWLGPEPAGPTAFRGTGAVFGALCAWWVFAAIVTINRYTEAQWDYTPVFAISIVLGPSLALVRLGVYCAGYSWPLGPIARLITGQFVIPRYDRVLIAPLVTLTVGIALPLICFMLRIPPAVATAACLFSIITCMTEIGPSLPEWRLTGAHRMTPTSNKHVRQPRSSVGA